MTARHLLAPGAFVAAAATLALAVPASAAPAPRTFEVTVTNLTDDQPLTPVLAVSHRGAVDLVAAGATATAGQQLLAEQGDPSMWISEVAGSRHVSSAVAGTGLILPGASVTFTVEALPGDMLSLASMFACTNDTFVHAGDLVLHPTMATTAYAGIYDAGTEVNTGTDEDIACTGGVGSPDEGGTIAHVGDMGAHVEIHRI